MLAKDHIKSNGVMHGMSVPALGTTFLSGHHPIQFASQRT